jgi:hypothetical protein
MSAFDADFFAPERFLDERAREGTARAFGL